MPSQTDDIPRTTLSGERYNELQNMLEEFLTGVSNVRDDFFMELEGEVADHPSVANPFAAIDTALTQLEQACNSWPHRPTDEEENGDED